MKRLLAISIAASLFASTPAFAKVKGEEVTYEANGTKLKGYVAYDDAKKGKRPAVIVVHEWWGHNAYARKRADMLAELGYLAFALDMYGNGKTADHPKTAGKFSSEVMSNLPLMKARFNAAMDAVKKNPLSNGEIAAIGYCFGGGVVLTMAREGANLEAVASFHGMLATKTPAKKGAIKARLFVAYGAADPFVPKEVAEAFKKEMKDAGADLKFISYEGAKHAFTNPDADENGKKFNLPLAYDKKADEASWKELQSFLKESFAQKAKK